MEDNTERLYHYHFFGVEKPITVLAYNRTHALQILQAAKLPKQYNGKGVESETTSQPLVGITTMKDGKKTLVWTGRSADYPDGWKEKE